MMPVAVRSVPEEFAYLDRWYGPSGYRLMGRTLMRADDGSIVDLIDLVMADGSRQQVWFTPLWIPRTYPAGQAAAPTSRFSGIGLPLLVLLGISWLAYMSRPEEKHRAILRATR